MSAFVVNPVKIFLTCSLIIVQNLVPLSLLILCACM